MSIEENAIGRRSLLRRGATAAGLGLLTDLEAYPQNVNRNSLPSDLKVTDIRIAVLRGPQGQAGAFTEEHKRLLTLFASRIASGIENARSEQGQQSLMFLGE